MPRRDRHDTQRVAADRVAADILRAVRRCGVARNHADRYDPTDRRYAELLDASDPVASLMDESIATDPDLLYLDGNSLGRLTRRTRRRLLDTVDREWAAGLVGSWESWNRAPPPHR
jgi:hypothetical protein